jgi:ring-1,2-phenylacetyl-CoA epoxidase subunit PaaC
MNEITGPQAVPAELKQPLADFLLALADDEFILGYWDSEWTGVAPILEEDVAMSSIAQDEIGHARLFYQEVADLTGTSPDKLAYAREPQDHRQMQLVERQRGDWAFTIARQFLYDTADQLRLEVLAASMYLPLAQDVVKIQREEVYHQMHVNAWLERLANSTREARQRLEAALESLWPDALGMFEEFPGEELLLQAGILSTSSSQLQQEWLATIAPIFEHLHLPFPVAQKERSEAETPQHQPTIAPRLGGRRGQHTQDFAALWEQMTMVYRLDPQASW